MIILVGNPRTGKTTIARALVREQSRRGAVYVSDPHGEYSGARWARMPVPIARRGVPVLLQSPHREFPARSPALAAQTHALIRAVDARGGTLVVDECGAVRGPRVDYPCPPELGRIAVQGGHPPLAGAILCAQRMQHIWPECRTDLRVLYLFRQISSLDVDLVLDQIPADVRPTIGRALPYLPNYWHYRLDLQSGRPLDLTIHMTPAPGRTGRNGRTGR